MKQEECEKGYQAPTKGERQEGGERDTNSQVILASTHKTGGNLQVILASPLEEKTQNNEVLSLDHTHC